MAKTPFEKEREIAGKTDTTAARIVVPAVEDDTVPKEDAGKSKAKGKKATNAMNNWLS